VALAAWIKAILFPLLQSCLHLGDTSSTPLADPAEDLRSFSETLVRKGCPHWELVAQRALNDAYAVFKGSGRGFGLLARLES
jgi:hypothetical protein